MSLYLRHGAGLVLRIGFGAYGRSSPYFRRPCSGLTLDRRELGGVLPPFIEVRSPVLDTRMKIDIPKNTDYSIFSHDKLVALCMKTLSSVQDWDVIIKHRLAEGAHMELAWRLDTNLDWVRWLDDIHGNPRTWAVLAGLALNQVIKFDRVLFLSNRRCRPHRRQGEPPTLRYAWRSTWLPSCT
jgi:hypothetical protein